MRKGLRIVLYVICGLLFVVLGAIVYLNTPWGQNFVRGRAEAYLNSKLKTKVQIGHLGYGLPKFIVLNDVLFLDQAKDTLLAAGELKIDINMLQLLHKEVSIQQIMLRGVHAHIYRNLPDTTFNFTYIITAFTGNKPKDPAKAKDTSSSSLKIDLDRVKLEDIHFRLDDQTGGMNLAVNLEHLDLNMKTLDLDKMVFHIKELTVAGLQTTFVQDSSYLAVHAKDTTPAKLTLVADQVDLQRIGFGYNSVLNKLSFGVQLGRLQLELKKFGLEHNEVDVKSLAINNTAVTLDMGMMAKPPATVDTIIKIDTTEGWRVKADKLSLANVNFRMDNENQQKQPAGIDYAHLNVANIMLDLRGLLYTSDSISGDIQHLAAREQSGIDVRELRTVFTYNQQGAVLSKLYLQTPCTILQRHLEAHYPSLAALQKNMQTLRLNVDVDNSIIGLHDVLVFAPQLEKQELFRKYKKGNVKLAARVTGSLGDLNIAKFYAAGMDNTDVLVSGRLKGLPDVEKLNYDLHIAKLQSSNKDISALVPDSLLKQVRIPDKFGITGQVAGTIKDYSAELYLVSTDGVAYLKGMLAMSPGKNKERYDVLVRTSALNIGHILKQDSLLGPVTAAITAKGQSFDVHTMVAAAGGDITAAMVRGYNYHDIKLLGKIAAQKADLDMASADSNVRIQLTGHADFSGKYAAARADIKVDSIDFRALKLYSTELRASGTIHADFPVLNPDYPQGRFTWWQPTINADGKRYYLDSLYVISSPSPDTGQNITANLDAVYVRITGKTPLTQIGPIITEHINRHYTFPTTDSARKSAAALKAQQAAGGNNKKKATDSTQLPTDYNLQLQAHIVDKPILHSILPGLTSFDSIHADASLTPEYLSLNLLVPDLVYGTTTIVNGKVRVSGTDSAFTYKVTADEIEQGDIGLWYADIHGNLDKDNISTSVSLADNTGKERFLLVADMQKVGDTQIVQLQPGLKLNYAVWDVAQPNRIVLANGGFYVQHFGISNGGQSITANSNEAKVNTPLKVDFTNFSLGNLTDAISHNDTLLAGGILSGTATIEQMSPAVKLTSDLEIKQLSVLGDTLGDLQVHAGIKDANGIDTKITLKGQGNDIALAGTYFLQQNNGNDFDLNLDVNALALHSFEAFSQHQIRNSSGYLRGKLALKGTTSAPQVTGELKTDELVTNISQLNATFKMPAEKITFTSTGITLNGFTIHDSADNKAVFSGNINTEDLSDIQLDLAIKAKNWRALHSTKNDNKVFYGDLLMTADLTVKGSATSPSVDGDLKILKGTNVTVVTPETNPEMQDTKGIVVFVNMKDTARRNVLAPRKKKPAKHKISAGSDFNVNVSVDKTAQFSLIIDQASGDFLSVKGDATLNAAVTAGGTISLTGTYALTSGSYQLNYNFIKRKFDIKDGSSITFAGDPINGTVLDVTAVYEAQVPPYDLVERQVPDPTQLNYYKQRLPFDVDLHMKGAVLTPQLTFDVQLPENKVYPLSSEQIELIQGKLSQVRMDTSELNKQVFALLILGRFVSDDPFSSGASTSASFAALQSVSTFIGEQLNNVAGKLVKGVDFSVDLGTTEDYTTGDMRRRTDLNLAASKRLLNDRLKLTIGNDFELEGPQTSSSETSLVPTNLAADYLLSADGRYTMRAYRKAYDEGVLQGYVTETGLNFILSLDYNNFKKAFMKKKPPKEDDHK